MSCCVRLLLCLLLAVGGAPASAQRSVTDLGGRAVAVPATVTRTATLGAVAPLNSFLFMLGKGDAIGNGLPPFFRTPYWAMQHRLAPRLASQPVVAGADGQASREALLRLAPDVVLSSARGMVATLEAAGLPVLYFEWKDLDDLLRTADLLGTVFHAAATAGDYRRYCEGNVARIASALAAARKPAPPPRAAFLRMKTLSQPARVADWTLAAAGAENVGRYSLSAGPSAMTQEMLLKSDPEVLIVWSREERDTLLADPRYVQLTAVRRRQVHAVPVGATPWLAPGAEQCLGVLWAARTLHPQRFADVDLVRETRGFYKRFYGIAIDAAEVATILGGMD